MNLQFNKQVNAVNKSVIHGLTSQSSKVSILQKPQTPFMAPPVYPPKTKKYSKNIAAPAKVANISNV